MAASTRARLSPCRASISFKSRLVATISLIASLRAEAAPWACMLENPAASSFRASASVSNTTTFMLQAYLTRRRGGSMFSRQAPARR